VVVDGLVVPNWQLPRPWCHRITGRRALHHQPPRAGRRVLAIEALRLSPTCFFQQATQNIHSSLTRLVCHYIGPTVTCHIHATIEISNSDQPHTRLQLPAEARVPEPRQHRNDAIHATMAETESHKLRRGRGSAGRRISGGAICAGKAIGG
jgi:hypothetical protein